MSPWNSSASREWVQMTSFTEVTCSIQIVQSAHQNRFFIVCTKLWQIIKNFYGKHLRQANASHTHLCSGPSLPGIYWKSQKLFQMKFEMFLRKNNFQWNLVCTEQLRCIEFWPCLCIFKKFALCAWAFFESEWDEKLYLVCSNITIWIDVNRHHSTHDQKKVLCCRTPKKL